ncbi:hypothetical protein [Bacteroides acidifaciens]|uniref:hypothetical protein n=1 Tax=Bacteroides acidifaciens TaxID=85831 RepID=UPI00258A6E72|nr:hypothetical protein [Bacteroides acidifaciens]
MIKNSLVITFFLFLLSGCASEVDRRVDTVLSISGANRTELETVLKHYKHEPQKLKAAKFLIANMRYHHSYYSVKNPRQHPLLDSLTKAADSLFYHSVYMATDSFHNENIQKLIDSVRIGFRIQNDVRVSEQSVKIFWKEDYDFNWITAKQLINHIDHVFEWKRQMNSVRRLSTEDFYEYVLPYRSIPDNSLTDFSDIYFAFMDKYLKDIDKDSVQNVVQRYNFVINQLCKFFPLYPYEEEIGYQELFFYGFHDCIPIASYGVSILRACGIPAAVEFNACYKQFQGRHYHGVVLDKNGNWLAFNPESSIPTSDNSSFDTKDILNIYRFMFSEQKDTPFFMEKNGEYVPDIFDSPFLKDVTSHLLKTIPLILPYRETGNNNLAYLAAFNSGVPSGIIPVTWGKINRTKQNVTFSFVIPDRYYFPVYYSPFGKSFSFGEPFYLDKGGKIIKSHIEGKADDVTLLRKFPMKQGLEDKAVKLIGTVIQASNDPGFQPCDTVGIIADTLQPYFQDIKLDMNKGPYQYYQIKTTDEYPHVALSELEFITDIRYGYENVIAASPLPILSSGDTLSEDKTEVRLMDEPLERIKWKSEYDGNPQTSPELYPTIRFMLKKPQFVTKIRMMPLNADNGIIAGNQYELFCWNNGEWKKILSERARYNYITVSIPSGSLLWLRNLTGGKEELPFYVDSDGLQKFIYP